MKVILSIVGLIILIGSATGRLLLPIPVSNPYAVAGTKLESTTISFIKPGTTTRAEVIQKLGEPSLDMPEIDLIAYSWTQVDYHLVLVLVGSTGVWGTIGTRSSPTFSL